MRKTIDGLALLFVCLACFVPAAFVIWQTKERGALFWVLLIAGVGAVSWLSGRMRSE